VLFSTVWPRLAAVAEALWAPRGARDGARAEAFPPPRRTKWTRRVPHPVLIGHAVQVPMVESISTIACGDRHCLAVSRDALAVYAWGAAANGRLGLPSVPRPLRTPPSLLPSGWRAGAPCGV